MKQESTEQELIRAETHLARALQRLSALRRAALCGSYDRTAFDQAIEEYRAAEADVLEARRAWALEQSSPTPFADAVLRPSASYDTTDAAPLEPTPHLRFVRWLVQTGRLSDWPAETVKAGPPEATSAVPAKVA